MSLVALPSATAAELLALPDAEQWELIDGQFVERPMGALAVWVAGQIFGALFAYAKAHGGWVFGDGAGYRCYVDDPERVRRPDASFIRADRLSTIPSGFLTLPPDLAVEVISPTDLYYEVEAKVAEYLAAGVRMVWLVNPDNQSVRVFQPGLSTTQLEVNDMLHGGDVLPGFACRLSDVFPVDS